jgi:hypothetical protein
MAEYIVFSKSMTRVYSKRLKTEMALVTNQTSFETQGYCFVCEKTSFHTDFLYSDPNDLVDGKRNPTGVNMLPAPVAN